MNKRFLTIIVILIMFSAILVSEAESGIYDPFHTKEEKIAMWKKLWDAHPNVNYTSVGKSYAGNDIWLFMAGNSSGGTILWDGEMHGNEDKGSEVLFLMAEWLLESGDPEAIRILEWNHILFIPQLNDQDTRGNANTEISPYGVDLNRNFETGWWLASPSDDTYGGPYPLSEPETQVLRNVFSTYKPTFYVNMHCGAGPYAAYYRNSDTALTQEVISRTNAICVSMGISPYRNPSFGSQGFAIGDAIALGVKSAWLIETVGIDTAWKHFPEHYEELVNTYLPKCLALFIAMAETCSSALPTLEILDITQHPPGNIVYTYGPVTVNATVKSSTSIKRVFMSYTKGNQVNNMVYMNNIEGEKWSEQIPPIPDGTTVSYTITAEDTLGNMISSEIHSYQTSDSVIPEFSSSTILTLLTVSSLFILIAKRHLKQQTS
ncbi:MAG: hypothetical protein D4S01_01520 [Dehalococcoidia bacterium]|nr:MAG: hypothetical protein D4S01_01520 [Dehalococcoidia bacterium]